MSKKIKVFCFTGTRADYPRIRPVLEEINNRKNKFDLGVVVTGQHLLKSRGNSIKIIQADPFNIISKISMFDEKDDSFEGNVKAYSNCVKGVTDLLTKNKPDVALISGDRVETLAVATVCRVLGVAICHIQGGEVSGTQDEVFRHSITKLSDVHCVATNLSKTRLLSLGENKKNIFVTGCPYIEYIEKKLKPVDIITKNKEYYIVCLHANTSNYKEKKYINIFFRILKKNFAEKEIVVLIPNTDPGYSNIIKIIKELKKWKVIENLVHNDYLYLLKNSQALLGNTSSGIREAPSYGIPFLSFGYRQENRERADNVIDLNLDLKKFDRWLIPEKILKFKKKLLKNNPYKKTNSSKKIVNCLEYTYKNKDKLLDKKFIHNPINW